MKKLRNLFAIAAIAFFLAGGLFFTTCSTDNEDNENEYTITVLSFIQNGSIKVTPTKAKAGEGIAVTAEPDPGYRLEDVYVIGANVTLTGTGNFRIFLMPPANVTVLASFEPLPSFYTATVASGITGGNITISPSIPVAVGTEMTVTAFPNSGYLFTGITITGANVTVGGTGSTRTFPMPEANVIVSATFAPTFTATVAAGITGGSITVNPATPVTAGTQITVTAQPDSGNQLLSVTVTGATVSVSGTGNTRTFPMPSANVTVSATFGAPTYLQVTARGPFWAGNWVNNEQSRIELTVVFDDATGKIAHINYTPLNSHISDQSNATFFARWTTNDNPAHPGTFRNYISSMTGLLASVVSQFQRPVGAVPGITGNHGIAGLTIDAVTGATETGRNFVSSVVTASQGYIAGEGIPSEWRP